MRNINAKFFFILIIIVALLLILVVIKVFDKRIQKIESTQQVQGPGK